MNKRILIIGGGAMGLLMVYDFIEAGFEAGLMTRSLEQCEALKTAGVSIAKPEQDITLKLRQEQLYSYECLRDNPRHLQKIAGYDAVIVAVKQYHLAELWPFLTDISGLGVPIIFLMNGLTHFHLEQQSPFRSQAYTAITHHGVTKTGKTSIAIKGRGPTYIGVQPKIQGRLNEHVFLLKQQLEEKPLSWQVVEDIFPYALKKGVINACINPLTALFSVKNGELLKNSNIKHMMRLIHDEIYWIIRGSKDYSLYSSLFKHEQLWQEIEEVCRNTSDNYSSMYQDIQQGRKTEVDAINGFFIKLLQSTEEANQHSVTAYYNTFLLHSIKALEEM